VYFKPTLPRILSSPFSPRERGEGARSADEGSSTAQHGTPPSSASGTFSPASRGRRHYAARFCKAAVQFLSGVAKPEMKISILILRLCSFL